MTEEEVGLVMKGKEAFCKMRDLSAFAAEGTTAAGWILCHECDLETCRRTGDYGTLSDVQERHGKSFSPFTDGHTLSLVEA